MLEYDPLKRKYICDDAMRACTKQKRKDRMSNDDDTTKGGSKRRGRPTAAALWEAQVIHEFNKAKKGRGENSRLCGDLSRLDKHLRSVKTSLKHPKACKVCGGDAYSTCGVCGVPLHYMPAKGKHAGMTCFFDYHSDTFFGLARDDTKVNKTKKSEWVYPTVAKKKENAKKIYKLI